MTDWVSTTAIADRNPNWKSILKTHIKQEEWSDSIQLIVNKILNDEELSNADGVSLFMEPNLFELGRLAHLHKQAMYDNKAYFNSNVHVNQTCLLYTSPSPRDLSTSRMPSSA